MSRAGASGRPPRAAVRAAVRAELADLGPGERVLVACSGGPDSLALLAATVRVAEELGLLVGAVIVDHGLQADSAQVAARAAEQARILGCTDVEVVAVEVPTGPGSGGLEAAARRARYAALLGCTGRSVFPAPVRGGSAEANNWILTAGPGDTAAILLGHTRDDQAETVLLGLARGSGTRSLAGMAGRSDPFRRPLLDLPRSVVAAAAAEAARDDPRLEPWIDPQNADPAHARVRVRGLLPVLEDALGPGIVDALARTARLTRADADALDDWAHALWAQIERSTPQPAPPSPESGGLSTQERQQPSRLSGGGAWTVPLEALRRSGGESGGGSGSESGGAALPRAVTTRLVRRFLIEAGCPAGALTADHVERVTALLDDPPTRAEVALPGGRRARREGHRLVVRA